MIACIVMIRGYQIVCSIEMRFVIDLLQWDMGLPDTPDGKENGARIFIIPNLVPVCLIPPMSTVSISIIRR